MSDKKEIPGIPNLHESRKGVIQTHDELEYGLRAVVRILGRRKGQKSGYFFEGFKVVFGSEIGEQIQFEETILDYENLRIIIKLPDPPSSEAKNREIIRHEVLKDYTLGADDMKTRSALIALESMAEDLRNELILTEKNLEKIQRDK